MTLPITYADGNTIHGADLDSWTTVINALVEFVCPPDATLVVGYTTTVTSVSTITLTVTSTSMQVLTGTTAQLVTLPTTSVVAGAAWVISNQSTQTVTVQSSGANTVNTITAGDFMIFTANKATPTAAADWSYTTSPNFPAFATTTTAAGTTVLNSASPQVQVFTGSSTQTVTLPTTLIPAGAQWLFVNQSTGAVTVNGSSSGTAVVLAANTTAVLTSLKAAPTSGLTDWVEQYGGIAVTSGKSLSVANTLTLAGTDGTTMTFPSISGNVCAPPASVSALGTNTVTSTTAITKILSSGTIPANSMAAGTSFAVNAWGTQAAATASLYYYIYVGTLGTTADSLVCSAMQTVAASLGSNVDGMITIRSTGSSGTCMGQFALAAGSAANIVSTMSTNITVNTQVSNFVTLACKVSTSTHVVQVAAIRWQV